MAETTFTLWRQRLGYGIADLSCNLVWQMISLYLMFFYTDVMGLPAYYVGLMFLVTRLVDGVADVLMGHVACKFRKIGVNDQFGQSGKAADVLREYGLTADQIAEKIKQTL